MGLQGIRHDLAAEQQFLKRSVGQFQTQHKIPLDNGCKQVTELREAVGWDLQAVPWRPVLSRAAGIQLQMSPFDLFQTFLIGGGLLVPCSSPGPPVIKQLTQVVIMVPGQGGQFQSVCFP